MLIKYILKTSEFASFCHLYNIITIWQYQNITIPILISWYQYCNITSPTSQGEDSLQQESPPFINISFFSQFSVEVHFNFEEVLLDRINIGLITGASSDKELSGVQWLQKKKKKKQDIEILEIRGWDYCLDRSKVEIIELRMMW